MSLLTLHGAFLLPLQGPGEHGRQHHPALLQRGHLHPGHRELGRLFARDPVGDLTVAALSNRVYRFSPGQSRIPMGDSFSRTTCRCRVHCQHCHMVLLFRGRPQRTRRLEFFFLLGTSEERMLAFRTGSDIISGLGSTGGNSRLLPRCLCVSDVLRWRLSSDLIR